VTVPSADQYVRFIAEPSPQGQAGTAALSTTLIYRPFQSFNMKPDRVSDDRTDEFRGTAQALTPDVTGFNAVQGQATGRTYPNGLGVDFFMLLGAPVSTAGGTAVDPDGGTIPAGATRHVWDSSVQDFSLIRTFELKSAYGNSSGVFKRDRGVTCTQLDLNIGDQNAPQTFTATYQGLFEDRIADPSLTPSYDVTTITPFYRGHFSIPTFLTGTGTPIGATLSFTNPVEPDPVLNTSLWPSNWSRPNQAGAVPRLSGTINAKSIDPDDYDAFLAATPFGYKCKWLHTINAGTAAYKYSMWITGAASFDDYEPDVMEHKLRHGANISWSAGLSGGTAAFVVTLVNAVAVGGYSSVG
jgi:hypothetical protein